MLISCFFVTIMNYLTLAPAKYAIAHQRILHISQITLIVTSKVSLSVNIKDMVFITYKHKICLEICPKIVHNFTNKQIFEGLFIHLYSIIQIWDSSEGHVLFKYIFRRN